MMIKSSLARWLLLSVLLGAIPAQAQTLIEARIADQRFQLEVVSSPDSRRQGLMGRDELAAGTGMLFDFPEGTRPTIWMRNMQISLDLLFVDEQARLVHVFADVPPCTDVPCDVYEADQPLRFVIEVPAGTANQLDLQLGTQLDLGGYQLLPPPAL